jgi:threonine dehydrogenase-like Zn-dependent dehydrogenase
VAANRSGLQMATLRNEHVGVQRDLIRAKRIDVTPIITHRFPLEEYKEAFRCTHAQGETGAVKILFEFGGN